MGGSSSRRCKPRLRNAESRDATYGTYSSFTPFCRGWLGHPLFSPSGITGKFQVSSERLLLALCFHHPSPTARAGISKRKRQRARSHGTMRPDIARLNYVYYYYYYYYYYSALFSLAFSRWRRQHVACVLLCARRGRLPNGVQLLSLKNSSPRHQTVLSFSPPLYGINVLAPSPDVINPRRVSRWRCLRVNLHIFL